MGGGIVAWVVANPDMQRSPTRPVPKEGRSTVGRGAAGTHPDSTEAVRPAGSFESTWAPTVPFGMREQSTQVTALSV